jgi:transposase
MEDFNMGTLTLRDINGYDKDIDQLKKELKETKNIRMHKRYSVLLLHFQGFTNKKIAEMEGLEPHAVGNYIKSYKLNGLEGLGMNYSPGAPSKLNKEQEIKMIEIITNNTPDEVGFEGRKNWTIEIIRQWVINEFNVELSHSGMAVILHRLNLSYTRPTYVLAKADKAKQETFKSDFEVLKKTP